MESSEDETDSSALQHAYSVTDMLDELDLESEPSEASGKGDDHSGGQSKGQDEKEAEGECRDNGSGECEEREDEGTINGVPEVSTDQAGIVPAKVNSLTADPKETVDEPHGSGTKAVNTEVNTLQNNTTETNFEEDKTKTETMGSAEHTSSVTKALNDINGNNSADTSHVESPLGGAVSPAQQTDGSADLRSDTQQLPDSPSSEKIEPETEDDDTKECTEVIRKEKMNGVKGSQASLVSNESDESMLSESNSKSVKMREKKSQSPDSDGVNEARVASDISGRFHIPGSVYANKTLTGSSEQESTLPHNYTFMQVNEEYESMEISPQACIIATQGYDDGWYENIPDSEIYENLPLDPKRNTLRRGASLRAAKREMKSGRSKHATFDSSMKYVRVLPDASSTDSTPDQQRRHRSVDKESTPDSEDLYESITLSQTPSVDQVPDDEDDYSWGSSEFESYEDDEPSTPGGVQEPISVTVEVKRWSDPGGQTVLDKLAARLGPRAKSVEIDEDDLTYLEVTLNMEKHPPPQLPAIPDGLTLNQVKRRHIVASIVDSERSYTASLRRIVEDYEKYLLMSKPSIISKSAVRTIFFKLRDILQCHNMFHIELAEYIRVWDLDEKIGNVFTASFSKSMVFDVYSAFVNNFTVAMETAKKQARQKQAFADFLKQKIQSAPDKLSLFGLMVKPVQRFPQFILCLQDLLKHTPREHHDRLALQLALTELENLTHKLNETKRESENRHEVKKIVSSLTGRFSLKPNVHRHLVRQDDVIQLDCASGTTKTKPRRLFLMNDQLVCTSRIQKDTDAGLVEKYKFKWSVPIRDVEIVEAEMPALYQIQGGPGRSTIVAPKLDKSTFSPWKKDLDDMMHDLPIVEQISNLTSQLRRSYPGLSCDLLYGLQRGLQVSIQQHSNLDLCILNLSVPTKNSRIVHTFRVGSPSVKQSWLLDLKNTKLSLDPKNRPGWYVPEAETNLVFHLPLFVKPLLIDVTKQNTRIQCAIPVMLPSHANPCVGTQHLWVCSNEANRGQVTIVSLHTSQPHVLESFTACHSPIVCAEVVPGYAVYDQDQAFGHDTVWMAMESNELCVRSVVEEERGAEPILEIDTHTQVTCLRFMDGRLYAGLIDGYLAIYNRNRDGVWQIEECQLIQLGERPVTCLLSINHEMWAACENRVHIIRVTARWRGGIQHHDVTTSSTEVGSHEEEVSCMVRAGVGLMVSFRGRGVIRIYNQETFNHLQDINVASSVTHILEGKDVGDLALELDRVAITFLLSSKGLLWIGTNCGCALTLPLPRLEGVPQIKGRPSVSYHAHIGPIRFLVPIHCGVSQLHYPPTSPPSSNQSQVLYLDQAPDGESDDYGPADSVSIDSERLNLGDHVSVGSVHVEGVTESETCDDTDDVFVDTDAIYDDTGDNNNECGFTKSDEYSENFVKKLSLSFDRTSDVVPNGDYLKIPNLETLGRNKWTSTPELRYTDSEEDVNNLYGSLLRTVDYEEYDNELMGPRRRKRPQSDMAAYASLVKGESSVLGPGDVRVRKGTQGRVNIRSKYATLPVVREDCPVYTGDCETVPDQNGHYHLEEDPRRSPTPPVSPLTGVHAGGDQEMDSGSPDSHRVVRSPTPSTIGQGYHGASKAVVVVSGGEGHINWSEENAGDTKYDDICLLLWQCRV